MSSLSTFSFRYVVGFVVVIFIALAIFAGSIIATPGVPPEHPGAYWTAYLTREKENNASNMQSPRILIYGGSDVLFGIDAGHLSQIAGRPAFNMGVHGGVGIASILNQAINISRDDDVVVVLPYLLNMYNPSQFVTRFASAVTYGTDNRFLLTGSVDEQLSLLSHIRLEDIIRSAWMWEVPYRRRENGYWAYELQQFGDLPDILGNEQLLLRVVNQLDNLPGTDRNCDAIGSPADYSILEITGILSDCRSYFPAPTVASIRRAIELIEDKGASVYFAIPPSIFGPEENLKQALIDIVGDRFINTEIQGQIPFEMVLDTPYHANANGRRLATAHLSSALCNRLSDCDDQALQREREVTVGYPLLAALVEPENLGELVGPFPQENLPMVRWANGPEASFQIFAPNSCENIVVIAGRANKSLKNMTVAVDDEEVAELSFRPDVLESIDIPLPSDNQLHKIVLTFTNSAGTDGHGPALLMQQVNRVSNCQ